MVGLALLRTVARTRAAAGPSSASRRASTSSRSAGTPCRAASSVSAARTVSVIRSGHWCSPMRAMAAARWLTALSALTFEPWPALPRAVSLSQAVPRSPGADRVDPQAVARVEGVGAGLADALGAALEQLGVLVGEEAGAVGGAVLLVGGEGEHDVAAGALRRSGPRRGRRRAPSRPCSSCRWRRGPRPRRRGSRRRRGARSSRRPRRAPRRGGRGRAGRRRTGRCRRSGPPRWRGRAPTPGCAARCPASASCSATYSAAGRSWPSPPPRLVVSIRIRSEVKRTTSSSAWASTRGRLRAPGRWRCP